MSKYREQYERVERWYQRLKSITDGRKHTQPSDYYQDEVLAFFINCYHLKDWIINDNSAKVSAQEVKDFVNQSEYLRVCGDICNGSKHLRIDFPKSNKNTRIKGRNFSLSLGEVLPVFQAKYKIISGRKEYDAFELATKCLEEWGRFIN